MASKSSFVPSAKSLTFLANTSATFEDRYPDAPDHPMFEKARRAAERAREPMVSLEPPLDELLDPATSDDRVMPPPIIDEGVPESKESMPSELRENYM